MWCKWVNTAELNEVSRGGVAEPGWGGLTHHAKGTAAGCHERSREVSSLGSKGEIPAHGILSGGFAPYGRNIYTTGQWFSNLSVL